MKPITCTIGAETYRVLDVVERTAEKSLYGAGTYVYLENTQVEQYPANLQWRARCEVVIKLNTPKYRFHGWNMALTLGTMYNARIDAAIKLFKTRQQEAQDAAL